MVNAPIGSYCATTHTVLTARLNEHDSIENKQPNEEEKRHHHTILLEFNVLAFFVFLILKPIALFTLTQFIESDNRYCTFSCRNIIFSVHNCTPKAKLVREYQFEIVQQIFDFSHFFELKVVALSCLANHLTHKFNKIMNENCIANVCASVCVRVFDSVANSTHSHSRDIQLIHFYFRCHKT